MRQTAAERLTGLVPMLAVRDLRRTIEWYTTGLGFELVNTFGDPPVWCCLRRDDVELFFNQPPASAFPPDWPGHVLAALHAKLTARAEAESRQGRTR
jgi:catechol 2,3-dioxygenase-like lactoylglutathione lyase family enzyme